MLEPLPRETDEFGDTSVFSEERLAKLKTKANEQFTAMCETIKRSEAAISGFAEWAQAAEKNERAFHTASKAYVETLKAIQDETYKCKF